VADGDYGPLATTCTSGITDMSNMFNVQEFYMNNGYYPMVSFNEDIGSWDVSNVTDMGNMFNSRL
jgi:surface protein